MNELEVRPSREGDIDQIRQIYAEPTNYAATLQLPYPSLDLWEKRLSTLPEGSFTLVACRADEVLGQVRIEVHRNPRRRHAANLGMAVKSSAPRHRLGSPLLAPGVAS